MRIAWLELVRYGPFDDTVRLDFPQRDSDLHVVFGPNEAGKSTVVRAVVDLICGIPRRRPFPFPHERSDLCVRARLEAGDRGDEVRRERGNKDPLPEGVWPHGLVDRDKYLREFALDHERLRRGGEEILQARDDIGRALLGAQTGVPGLEHILAALRGEAEDLWTPRGRSQAFPKTQRQLEQIDKEIREYQMTAAKWRRLRDELRKLDDCYARLDEKIETLEVERRRLERMRRVLPVLRRLRRVEQQLDALGPVPDLPSDARDQLERAERSEAEARARVKEVERQLKRLQDEREAVVVDEALLARGKEIEALEEERAAVCKALGDLPRRRAELETETRRLRELADELGWPGEPEEIAERIPRRADLTTLRRLLNERSTLQTRMETAKRALDEASRTVSGSKDELAGVSKVPDPGPLAAAVRAADAAGELAARIDGLHSELHRAQESAAQLLRRLGVDPDAGDVISGWHVPSRDEIENHRRRRGNIEREIETVSQRRADLETQLNGDRSLRAHLVTVEGAVPAEVLTRAREHRDRGWTLLRRRYVEGRTVEPAELDDFAGDRELADAYEEAVLEADRLADARFEKAETHAQLAKVERAITATEAKLGKVVEREKELKDRLARLDEGWLHLWAEVPVEPGPPETMTEWPELHRRALEALDTKRRAGYELECLQRREAELRRSLEEALAMVGRREPLPDARPLTVLFERAREVLEEVQETSRHRSQLEQQLQKAERQETERRRELEEMQQKAEKLAARWREATSAAGLDPDADLATVEEQLMRLEELREVLGRVRELQEKRIAAIEADERAFRERSVQLLTELAPELKERDELEATIDLRGRLSAARTAASKRDELDQRIGDTLKQLEAARRELREAMTEIDRLQERARAADTEELRQIIGRAEKRRLLEREWREFEEQLDEAGEGRAQAELEAECEQVDADALPEHLEQLEDELGQLRRERERVEGERGRRQEDRRRMEGTDEQLVELRARRQQMIVTMADIARRYVRLQAARRMLEQAAEYFRAGSGEPLLRRAGELFAALTRGSFTGLRVETNGDGHGVLLGVRPDQSALGVEGMSEGTTDQLWLALRLAAVEEQVGTAPLPFIADDLLVNFDDTRAEAGLEVLAELAQRTQVLFFTHHRHLVNIARRVLGTESSVVELRDPLRIAA